MKLLRCLAISRTMELNLKLIVIFSLSNLIASVPLEKRKYVASLDLSLFGQEIYNTPDQLAGRNLKEWVESKKMGNPEEQGTYFEGDIMIDVEARNGVVLSTQKWPNGLIPYVIKGNFSECITAKK